MNIDVPWSPRFITASPALKRRSTRLFASSLRSSSVRSSNIGIPARSCAWLTLYALSYFRHRVLAAEVARAQVTLEVRRRQRRAGRALDELGRIPPAGLAPDVLLEPREDRREVACLDPA